MVNMRGLGTGRAFPGPHGPARVHNSEPVDPRQPPWCKMGPEPGLDTLGARLKYVREKVLGWTSSRRAQEELKRAGLDIGSHTTVLRYERGERVPGADYVAELCARANISADWLLTGRGPRERPPSGAQDPYREGAAAAITAMFERLLEIAESVGIEWPTAPAGGEEGQEERLAKRMKAVAEQRREHHRGDLERRRAGHDR